MRALGGAIIESSNRRAPRAQRPKSHRPYRSDNRSARHAARKNGEAGNGVGKSRLLRRGQPIDRQQRSNAWRRDRRIADGAAMPRPRKREMQSSKSRQ